MRAGACFAPATSAHPTAVNGSSSPPDLPTPKARDWKGRDPNPRGPDLIEAVRLLKTPTANLGTIGGAQHPRTRKAGGHGPNLADEVEHLLPTPKASDGTKGSPNQRYGNGDLTLPSAAARLHPPPSTGGGTCTPLSSPPAPDQLPLRAEPTTGLAAPAPRRGDRR